jgi:UDP-N-acetylmuramoylalanine--D-glutamate ligase
MAAIGVAFACGIEISEIKKVLPQHEGIPHRLELVLELDGVKYYNDTAATIPDAAILALDAFSQPLVLIAGGTDKNLEFEKFAEKILQKSKHTILLEGSATKKIVDEIKKIVGQDFMKSIEIVSSMDEAVLVAKEKAQKGDVVLLSPGAASFGLFDNEFDRGDKFREAVKKLNN